MSLARLALRLAARELKRESKRSTLIATLIAIPIAALAAGVLLLRSPTAPDLAVSPGAEGEVVALILAFVAALVCLLTGSAFLVAAKAQQRALAVIASVGTSRAVLVAISGLTGPLIGGVGGVIGTVVGSGLGWLVVTATGTEAPSVSFALVAALVGFAVILGGVAALPPALAASRADVVLAITGSTLPSPPPRRLLLCVFCSVAGLVLAVGSGFLKLIERRSTTGSVPELSALTALAPFVAALLMVTGATLAIPFLLRRWGSDARRWGLAARLAARDANRNRTRHLPVIAAIMGTTFLAVFVLCSHSTSTTTTRITYPYMMMPGSIQTALIGYPADQGTTLGPTVAAGTDREALAAAITTMFTDELPIDRLTIIETPRSLTTAADSVTETSTLFSSAVTPPAHRCLSDLPGNDRLTPLAPDPRCRNWYTGGIDMGAVPAGIVVGDASTLATILDAEPSPAGRAALARGEAVALHPDLVDATGTVELNLVQPAPGTSQSVRLQAVVEDTVEVIPFGVIISPDTADQLELETEPSQVLATTTRDPTARELAALEDRLATVAGVTGLRVHPETGPPSDPTMMWLVLVLSGGIVIAASVVALTLSRTEGRRDSQTLRAVGASAQTLRATAAWQGLTLVGIGTAGGTVIGLISAFSMNLPGAGSVFSVPWLPLLTLAVATPLGITVCGWFFAPTGSAVGSEQT